MNIVKSSSIAFLAGSVMVTVPATVTFLIASSRAMLIDLVANAVFRVLTCNTMRLNFYGLSLIELPSFWKFSKMSANMGVKVMALSFLIGLMHLLYTQNDSRVGIFSEWKARVLN
jgi:hypothetical protein